MIKRKGDKFFVAVFTPKHEWKLLGSIMTVRVPDEIRVFCTHFKQPDKHFYIKGQGYPINSELLTMLHNARINFIIIPEDGKRGFKTYIARTKDYLNGSEISEPLTERQRYVPLKECSEINVDRLRLKFNLYGGKKC